MNHDILQTQGRKGLKQQENTVQKEKEEQEDVDCVDTKIWIWDQDEYEEFDSDFLNQIFPYKINKKTMTPGSQFIFHFLSSSLYYWIQLVQEGQPELDKLGKKDIKVIDQILKTDQCQNWIAFRRWGECFNKKQQFHHNEEIQQQFVPPLGQDIHTYQRNGQEFVVTKYSGDNKEFYIYKQRIEVLLLFYIDGVSFIYEETDNWVYYVTYKRVKGSKKLNFVGVLSKYVFRLSTIKQRHRISQVFILPAYQKSGHGKELIDVVYGISLADNKCFQITTEIPSFQYQCLRDYKEIELLLNSKIVDISQIKNIINKTEIEYNKAVILTKQKVRRIKEELKIPGHQIERLANILIYYKIQSQKDDMPKAYFQEQLRQKIIINRSPFKTRRKLPHITFFGQVPNLKEFMLEKAREDILRNQQQVQEILTQTINGFTRVISKLIKAKMLP